MLDNRLCLAVRLVIDCLEKHSRQKQVAKLEGDSNIVKASLSDERGQILVNLVGVSLEPDEKCMISIFVGQNDKCLGSSIFYYQEDFAMKDKLAFPIDLEQFKEANQESLGEVTRIITEKLNIDIPVLEKLAQDTSMNVPQSSLRVERSDKLTQDAGQTQTRSQPDDMPRFEDEYEIHESKNARGLQERVPPSYGETDLYPTGQKYPNLMDPTASMTGLRTPAQGGMTFDPVQEQERLRQEQEKRMRGPGFLPGAKFDDPYGHPGGGFAGPNSGFGFGGGFI